MKWPDTNAPDQATSQYNATLRAQPNDSTREETKSEQPEHAQGTQMVTTQQN